MSVMPAAQVYAQAADKPNESKKLLSEEEVVEKKKKGHKQKVKEEQFKLAEGVKNPNLGTKKLTDVVGTLPDKGKPKFDPSERGAEKLDLRNLQSRSYATKSGAEEIVVSALPQNFKDADGKFKPIEKNAVEDTEYNEKSRLI